MSELDGAIILGHPRSGTTLLRRLLNAHKNLSSPPETHIFSACARFLHSDQTAHGVDMGVLAGLDFAGFSDDEVKQRLRDMAFYFLGEYARREGKKRWVEKTAFDIFHIEQIESLCRDRVYYIGIVRHPFDVAVSSRDFCLDAGVFPAPMHEYIKRYPQMIEAFVHSWVDTTEDLIALGSRHPGKCVMCRYEDLVQAPLETVGGILEAIGEDTDVSFIESALRDVGTLGFSDHKTYQHEVVHEKSIARWQELPREQVKRLAKLVNPLMAQLGYEPFDDSVNLTKEELRRRYKTSLLVHSSDFTEH